MKKNKKVQILMSTFNGEKYIDEQINSILNQSIKLKNIFILVRDDGSDDDTISILNKYKYKYPKNFDFYRGSNLGPCYSFLDLINKANKNDFDYFAFSDQDDFWLPQKLEKAILQLSKKDNRKPLLYSSKYFIVNSKLEKIFGQSAKKINFTSFENSLIENVATGCTEVFNKEMLLLADKINIKKVEGFFMHDWLLYMIATSLGKYIYDENSYLLYRQHKNNVLGASRGKFNNLSRKFKLLFKYNNGNIIRSNIEAFYKVYGTELSPSYKLLLEQFITKSFKNNFKLAFNKKIKRQKLIDELIFRVLIIINFL